MPACKAAAYFAVPAPMRERLWPWRQRHLEIFAQLQREGKMPTPPTPPTCNKCVRPPAPSAFDNFKAALWPVLQEMHTELSGDQSRLDMLYVIWGIWSELSVNDQAQWARRA